jgi:hypothetical protein
VSFKVESIDEADVEFLALPPDVREVHISAFRELAASANPVCSGPNWFTEELRQRQRIAPEGLFYLHVQDLWRGAFFRTGDSLVFIAFGFRIPEFYDKLERLRSAVTRGPDQRTRQV